MFSTHSSHPGPRPSRGPQPPSSSQPTSAPPPMPTFTSIIDLDHDEINAAAQSLTRLLRTPPPPNRAAATALRHAQLSLLHTVTWRLIRHDLSEELVMRPAMIAHMGAAGLEAAQHDREDHDHARATLLELYAGFASLPAESQSEAAKMQWRGLVARYMALMRELVEHMRRESGEEMPALEQALGRSESRELGRRYLETQVVTPELVVRGRRVWRDVGAFVGESKEGFLAVWREVVREREEREWRGRRGGKL